MVRMLRRRIRKREAAWRKLCRFLCFSAPIHWGTRVASAIRPVRAAVFSLNLSRGIRRLRTAGTLRRPPLGQKGKDTCGFPSSLNSYLSLRGSGADCRHVTAAKMGNGSRVTTACLSPPFRSSQIAYCYTGGQLYAGCGIIVPHNSLARYYSRACEDKLYQMPKFAGAVRYNVPTGCAARLCRACVE